MSDSAPEPLDPNLQIQLPSFEGPLDLLLHLIRKHELDILDLPIAFVTERYLQYLGVMKQLDLDVASEYLVMAATLAHIKSKMLLPQEPDDQEDLEEEEADPRAELIRRLLEYQKYKHASEQLGARGVVGRDVFPRGSDAPRASGPAPLASTSLFKLLDAFQRVLDRAQASLAFEITAEGISIQDRMRELVDHLREAEEVQFDQLFEGEIRVYDIVVTFLALLEMAKRRLVQIYQVDPAAPLHLRSAVIEDPTATGAEGASDSAWETDESEPSETGERDDEAEEPRSDGSDDEPPSAAERTDEVKQVAAPETAPPATLDEDRGTGQTPSPGPDHGAEESDA